jgi:hypothetical protein
MLEHLISPFALVPKSQLFFLFAFNLHVLPSPSLTLLQAWRFGESIVIVQV